MCIRDRLRQLIKSDSAYQFLQNVHGSLAYFQRAVRELIATVAQIGCPQFFVTLSAADMSWPEMFQIIGQQSGCQMTDDDISTLSYEEKSTMLHNDPVLAARHFDHRHKAFFRIKILLRGSPHAHCLIWMADGPDMSFQMLQS